MNPVIHPISPAFLPLVADALREQSLAFRVNTDAVIRRLATVEDDATRRAHEAQRLLQEAEDLYERANDLVKQAEALLPSKEDTAPDKEEP